ncbi:helix-turn-helix domain-containing protein [Mesorhizobium sp. AR07]|nr:helix-turn-helix transcriptional regulator [Mesorhizobium sp. AR07]UVK46782.1 helix-turn-helix domain-containing protein [Mesorhizobium sp. AR07]
MSQNTFAGKLRVNPSTITFWKSGRSEPRIGDFEEALSKIGKKLAIVDI